MSDRVDNRLASQGSPTLIVRAVGTLARLSAVRFLLVGVTSLGIDAGTLFVLHGVLRLWLPAATALAYITGLLFNFGFNRLWSFEASGAAIGRHFFRYVLLVGANLGLNVLLISALTGLGLFYLLAKVLCTSLLVVMNYFVSKKWIYT
ncbi:GtrA family protein [Dactylosporangium roseum]|uniref:GtrA family protein n=1 Tax=Dactylosporangium roseum TaxID=47989 RepID=A0ABY5Z030_9ACTN|nr:GtrA family protein [Dactylosporangium roseum]UWZ35365.1 GtrA family protein [Dactylosporangium roseum]